MKTFLLMLAERVANAFREADYTQGRDAYLRSYGASRTLMTEPPSAMPLRIGHEDAIELYRGGPHIVNRMGRKTWAQHVYHVNGDALPVYTVYGGTDAQVEARAAQLVSALDGARRL